jgi:hypothetical protein
MLKINGPGRDVFYPSERREDAATYFNEAVEPRKSILQKV